MKERIERLTREIEARNAACKQYAYDIAYLTDKVRALQVKIDNLTMRTTAAPYHFEGHKQEAPGRGSHRGSGVGGNKAEAPVRGPRLPIGCVLGSDLEGSYP